MEKPYKSSTTQGRQSWHSMKYQVMIVIRMFSSFLIFIISAIRIYLGFQILILTKAQNIIESLYKHITKIHISLVGILNSTDNTKLHEASTLVTQVETFQITDKKALENRVEGITSHIELKDQELVYKYSDKDQELVTPLLTTPPSAHSMQISVPESMSSEKNNSKGRHWKQFKFRRVDENLAGEPKPPIWQYTFPSMKKQKTKQNLSEEDSVSVKHRFKRITSTQGDS